ncbi:MAG: hypothetical protein Q9181_006662 [Wetmoreana brouardii]
MPPSKPAYDIDWIFSNSSNVHVANHRDWFTSYTPFITTFVSFYSGRPTEVLGLGDVALPTKTHPTRTGTACQGTIVLRDVLYVPEFVCNIFGLYASQDRECNFKSGPGIAKITDATTGACIGVVDRSRLFRLRLRGQSAKQTSLDPEGLYVINATWPSSERARWLAFKEHNSLEAMASCVNAADANMLLTQLEKDWMKHHYRNEFHFLRSYGLSIYKDEDREEGRRILRALMGDGGTDHGGDNDEDDNNSGEESVNSFARDLEEDPSSHAADYHFSADELDWIKKNYGHSANFLLSYGLKFYDDEDFEEGKAIIRAFLCDDMDKEDLQD